MSPHQPKLSNDVVTQALCLGCGSCVRDHANQLAEAVTLRHRVILIWCRCSCHFNERVQRDGRAL